MNRYLQDRASRRSSRGRSSSRGSRSGRGRDRGMDYGYDYAKYDNRYDSGYSSDYRGGDYHNPQYHREHPGYMEREMYGYGYGLGMPPMYDHARGGRRDMADYSYVEAEWKEDLEEWCKELKRNDRFGLSKEQAIHSAKQMGVKFEDYTEEEYVTVYYMLISDFPKVANEPHMYLTMAKEWLEDKDSKLKGSERLSAYYYEIVKGGEDD